MSADPGTVIKGETFSSVDRRTRVVDLARRQGLLAMVLLLILFFSLRTEYFFSIDNFWTIGATSAVLGIMAISQTFLIISGGFDISVGSVVAMAGVTLGTLVKDGTNVWIAALVAILVGGLIGCINGVLVVLLGINPLIATLGTLSIFSGLAYTISSGNTLVVVDNDFSFLGSGFIGPVPFPLVLFTITAALALVVERMTPFGRSVYAIGGNKEAARLSGIRVRRNSFVLYVASGTSAGLAGVIVTSQLASGSPQVGSAFLLSVVTAVILGGASLDGGRGTVIGTLIAVAILGVLQNGFAQLQFNSFTQTMALGVVLIVAVLLDISTNRVSDGH